MSKIVASAVLRGANTLVKQAEADWQKALKEKGDNQKIAFPETAFYFPFAYALMGHPVNTLKDIKVVMDHAQSLIREVPTEKVWLPYLGDVLDAGLGALLSEEIICALRYLNENEPQPDCIGFFSDTILRSLGIQLVDGRMPGFAAILGAAPDNKTAVDIIRSLQQRNILTFVGSSTDGKSIIDQLLEEKVEMGWDNYIVPYGRDTITGIYPLNWAIRGAMTFGGIKPGEGTKCLEYCKDRVFAFGMTLGEVDDIKYATGAGAIAMGFPVITDTKVPEIKPSGVTLYEALVNELDHKKIVQRCIEVRGVKVSVSEVPVPVLYGAAFEGERVRKEQVAVEYGSKFTESFEYLRQVDADKIEDGKIIVSGTDIGEGDKTKLPLMILTEVSGRKMQKDFEPIIERQIHKYVNYAMGIMHVGQRNMNWIRVSKEARDKGMKLEHFGKMMHAMIHQEFGAIVDKVQVTVSTDEAEVKKHLPTAIKAYNERDERLAGMTDESVDTIYSCTLCQSFAPNHVCVVTPERLGLCGAYSWLDCRASHQINPTGPNQPIEKKKVINEKLGQWEEVNEFVYKHSNQSIETFSAYSIMNSPMTSCGCFECIVAILPEANGVMVVDRDYSGQTPIGMTFTQLAGTVGGGNQVPGFIGVGRLYVVSKKFVSAEGGLPRLIWMPSHLKEALGEKIKKQAEAIGMPDLLDKIGDETIAKNSEGLMAHLKKVNHPALTMDPLM